jgi:hypothetical protein
VCFLRMRSSACRCRLDPGGSRLRPRAVTPPRAVFVLALGVKQPRFQRRQDPCALPLSDKSGSRERRPRAVGARAEERLADRRPCTTSKRSELSLLRAIGRSFVSLRWVVEVRVDRGFCASEPARDVGDREALLVAVVVCECGCPTALLNAVQSHHASDDTGDRRRGTSVPIDGRLLGS